MFPGLLTAENQTSFLTETSLHACQDVVSRAGNICQMSNIFQKFE